MAALVGRDTEMARLRGLLEDAVAGRAVTALVGGDAGVGKSRLVAELMTIAGRNGFTVLCGQCAEIGDSVPYLPFADAFRTAPSHIEQAVKARPVLARLLPDGDEPAEGTDPSGMARQQMFGAVLGALAEFAATSPVLLVLEDLHWADATTRHLVTFLARMLRRERVAIVGTFPTGPGAASSSVLAGDWNHDQSCFDASRLAATVADRVHRKQPGRPLPQCGASPAPQTVSLTVQLLMLQSGLFRTRQLKSAECSRRAPDCGCLKSSCLRRA